MTNLIQRPPATPEHRPVKRSLVVGVSKWSLRHPVMAVLGWVILVVVCVLGGNLAGMTKATDNQLTPGEAGRAAQMITNAGLDPNDTESVLISSPAGGRLTTEEIGNVAVSTRTALAALPIVKSVAPPVLSADGTLALLSVELIAGAGDDNATTSAPLRSAIAAVSTHYPGLTLETTGSLTINADVNQQVSDDFASALVLSLPITILILLVAFGALLAAGVPVLLGASSVLAAVGLYTATSHIVPDGGTTAEIILLIGMAVGVDYSLFYLKRDREERQRGRSAQQALTVAAATAGHAVVTSGGAVIVAMAGLFLLGDLNFAGVATGAIIVVALAVIGSLTVLPAILGLLGERVDRPRIPLLSRLTLSGRPARVWPRLLRPAMRFPVLTLIVGVAGMMFLAWPATSLHLKNSTEADLPQNLPAVVAYNHLTAAFPGDQSHLDVVARGTDSATVIRKVEAGISGRPAFGEDPEIMRAGDTVVLSIAVPYPVDSQSARDALTTMRQELVPAALAASSGVQVAVGGAIAGNVDYVHEISSRAPWVFAFVLLMTFLLMTFVFRSVVVGLVTIAANLLSAGAAFGVLALVFQSRWGADLLGFHLSGGVIAWIPVFLFVVLFGLSMDYHVLVISRIKEATDRGVPIRAAVQEGITGSASVITSAAAVMIGVFAIFAGLHLVEFKELGVGLGVAVFLDAIVVRILILPALMSLLGDANWWAPRFLRRRPVTHHTAPLTANESAAQ